MDNEHADAFVPRERRVATFDNDGTLWCEKPSYVQAAFLLDRWREMAESDPGLRDTQPWKAAFEGDLAWFADLYGHLPEILKGVVAHDGITPEAAYRPMRELLDLLDRLGISHQDWMPTLVAAAGEPNVKEQLAEGHQAGDKRFRVHLDGYNFLPFSKGETDTAPREEYLYFSQGGELNAVRWNDWKVHFAVQRGNIATGTRDVTGWPTIVNLRADPFERAPDESGMYIRWYGEQMWLFIPVQQKLQECFKGFMEYPYQLGSSLNAANISYQTLRLAEAQRRLGKLEELPLPAPRN